MGKPYALELNKLPRTYAAIIQAAERESHSFVQDIVGKPLVAVGSGGSFSAAVFAATLHERLARQPAKAMTPFELRDLPGNNYDSFQSYLLISSGGRNSDTLAGFRELLRREPNRLIVLTAQRNSPLINLAKKHRWVQCVHVSVPAGRDGFLATNSLAAFAIRLTHGYNQLFCQPEIPRTFDGLLTPETLTDWRIAAEPLWSRDDLVVLFSPSLRAAAVDLESKYTEAALGHVLAADFRNFAHGRHHWLAKRADTSAVLALHTRMDREIANRTLNLLPPNVPRAAFEFIGPPAHSMLSALVASIVFIGGRGQKVGIDPGRPGVPLFGRRIYHLTIGKRKRINQFAQWRNHVLTRKAGWREGTQTTQWNFALTEFLERLQNTTFHGIVFDYDGTLCDSHERFTGICQEISVELIRILKARIPIGIATGRGKSVKNALRLVLPEEHWSSVLIGCYSGAQIARLSDSLNPNQSVDSATAAIANLLNEHPALANLRPEIRPCQLSFTPPPGTSVMLLWEQITGVLTARHVAGWRAFFSDHSVDIVAPGVSKSRVVEELRKEFHLGSDAAILCFGDQAREPGNDAELLAEPLSLSVGSSSARVDSGWNLAPPGERGVSALLKYFQAIRPKNKTFQIETKLLMI
jgi:hydroxymethylpyrimidine pyrophosphatase-like HAD family hydrolase/fructoselysine-6-P-deglycase FrlB-like protein